MVAKTWRMQMAEIWNSEACSKSGLSKDQWWWCFVVVGLGWGPVSLVTERCRDRVPALLNCSSCTVALDAVGIFRLAVRLGMSHWIFGHSWPQRARQPCWDRVLSTDSAGASCHDTEKAGRARANGNRA